MTGILVRRMHPDEADRVGELTLAAYDAVGSFDDEYRAYLAAPMERIDRCTALLVAAQGGEVVGTLTIARPSDGEFEGPHPPAGDHMFRMLAVDPAVQGQGVGRALLDTYFDWARADGARRVFITSMVWMTGAHRMYEHRGFVRRPDLDVRFPTGVGWSFTKDLTDDAPLHFPPPGPVPDQPPWWENVWV